MAFRVPKRGLNMQVWIQVVGYLLRRKRKVKKRKGEKRYEIIS